MAGGAGADHEYAFGVLGTLRVTRSGIPLSLGGRQQRAVLARLLLADDAGLTVDQLADAVWGTDVPAVAQAKSTQLTDPPKALALWAQIDRRIVDDAPIVPTANQVMNVFTSARVGDVQTSPLVVFLIDQMWVK